MMSKFASSIKIYVGRVKDAEEPTDVVIFEM